jgi:YHS domain-containing protein
MRRINPVLLVVLSAFTLTAGRAEDKPKSRSPREALQVLNDLVGTWKATGTPEDKPRDFWRETMTWQWQFKGDDAWLQVAFDKGKYYLDGELRYLPDREQYQLTLRTLEKTSSTFVGTLQDRRLTLERTDDAKKESQRLVFNFLHDNRILYRCEVKSAEAGGFSKVYQVGATKEGVPFAGAADSTPECIVTGGPGTLKFTYKGQTYYFCCSGCRDAFKEDPEKYLKEFEAKKAKEKER